MGQASSRGTQQICLSLTIFPNLGRTSFGGKPPGAYHKFDIIGVTWVVIKIKPIFDVSCGDNFGCVGDSGGDMDRVFHAFFDIDCHIGIL